jgi:CheY-like chemotaxis protein
MGVSAPRVRRSTGSLVVGEAERRRHRRIAVPAVAAVSVGGKHLGIFAVADLSSGGALLVGDAQVVPTQIVDLQLQISGHRPLALRAKVLRRQVGPTRGKKVGVRFEPCDASTMTALATACTDPKRLPPNTEVLVVWNRPGGSTLPRDLETEGVAPLVVASPLEAAAWLRTGDSKLECVLVDYLLAGSNGWDFLQYLREAHPDARRILLVDGIGNFRLNLLLASGLADAVLEKPWNAASLLKKLRRRG